MKKLLNFTGVAALLIWSYSTFWWEQAESSVFYWFYHFFNNIILGITFLWVIQCRPLWTSNNKAGIHKKLWLTIFISTLLSGFFRAGYVADLTGTSMLRLMIHINSYGFIMELTAIVLVGYAINRLLFLPVNWKKLCVVAGVLVGIIILTFFSHKWYEAGKFNDVFEQGKDFVLIDDKVSDLEELLAHEELKNNKICIDLWYSSCGPCLEDFEKYKGTRDSLRQNGWVFLYLGRETSHANSYTRWLNTIEKYDLKGYHFYMPKSFESAIQARIQEKTQRYLGYPHYLIVNESSKVLNWDAKYTDLINFGSDIPSNDAIVEK